MKERELTNPLLGYVVIAVALILGTVAASVSGQSPSSDELKSQPKIQIKPNNGPSARLRPTNPDQSHGRRWVLGVRAKSTDAGYVVQRVELGSAAEKVGLEPGDRIVTVNGFQVGLVERDFFELSRTLESCGGRHGLVRLLVQDRRSGRLVSMRVQLRHPLEHLGH